MPGWQLDPPAASASFREASPVIFADTKELQTARGVISRLRDVYGIHVIVCSLPHGGYILGNATAVYRLGAADVSGWNRSSRHYERLQQLQASFHKVFVLMEQPLPDGMNAMHDLYFSLPYLMGLV